MSKLLLASDGGYDNSLGDWFETPLGVSSVLAWNGFEVYRDQMIPAKSLISLARPEGFEPPTPRFVVWCSIQLSYGRVLGACRPKLRAAAERSGAGPGKAATTNDSGGGVQGES